MADKATLVFDIESAQAVQAAKNLEKMGMSAKDAAREADRLSSKFSSGYSELKKFDRSFSDLDKGFNSGLISAHRYSSEISRLNTAQELARSSGISYASALSAVDNSVENSASGVKRAADGFGVATHKIQNFGYQIGDAAVQIGGGVNPIVAINQQLPQLLGSFGAIGAVAGAASAILGAVWIGMSSGASSAERLTKNIDNLKDAVEGVKSASNNFQLSGLEELRKKYGEVDSQVLNLIKNQKIYADMIASAALKNSLEGLVDAAGSSWLDIGLSDYVSGVLRLQNSLSVTREDAVTLKAAFDSLAAAKTPQEQEVALSRLAEYMVLVAQKGGDAQEEALRLLKAINDATDAVKQLNTAAPGSQWLNQAINGAQALKSSIELASDAMATLRSLAGSVNVGVKGSAATLVALQAGQSEGQARLAGQLAEKRVELSDALQSSEMGVRIEAEKTFQSYELGLRTELGLQEQISAILKSRADAEKESSAGGGGGAALTKAQKQFQSLQELLEQETLFEVAEYEKRKVQLDTALSQRLLSEQKYNEMRAQLQTFYFGTDAQKEALNYQMSLEQLELYHSQGLILEEAYQIQKRQLQQQYYTTAASTDQSNLSSQLSSAASYFGQMNQLAGGGYEKLAHAQRVFAASSALINTYLAATQALADPTVPFWGKIAAMGSVLAAGMGVVGAIKSGSSSVGKGGGSSSSRATAAAKAQPTSYVTIDVTGDSWAVSLVEGVIEQIQEQTKDGRVVFMGNGR